jgi:hypothetical protein
MITTDELEKKIVEIIALITSCKPENHAICLEICFEILEELKMPLPTPRPSETEDNFMSRCMADDTVQSEYPSNTQRYAVCVTQWNKKEKENE